MSIASAAHASIVTYEFPIVPNQEVHNPASIGGGWGVVTLDTVGDEGMHEITWDIKYALLTSDVTMAHFHGPADFGVNAGVTVNFNYSGGTSGQFQGSTQITESQRDEVLNGLWYVNIHTEQYGAGEIRGQIIPEPGTMMLVAAGGSLLLLRRRAAKAVVA